MIIGNAKKDKYTKLTPTELKNLIQAAQGFDENAIDRLCTAFEPLIYKEAFRSYIQENLGKEDAINTAWEIFLEFIHSYNKASYRCMPLLLQIHLHHELTHKVSRKASVKDTAILDATDNNGNLLLNPSDNNEFMNKFHKQRLIHELLSKLSEKQRNVIIATIINDYSLDDFAKDNGISYTAAFRLRERALELMRQEL